MDVSFSSFLCAREKDRMGSGGIPQELVLVVEGRDGMDDGCVLGWMVLGWNGDGW